MEKIVYTSRGQVAIWLPSRRVEKLRALGAKIASSTKTSSKEEGFKNELIVEIHKEIRSEICELCESIQLRHGSDIATDVLKAFPAGSAH